MKKSKVKGHSFILLLGILLAMHFILVSTSVAPKQLVPEFIKKIGDSYVNPLFSQSWSLFVPAPSHNKMVLVGFTNKDQKTEFQIVNPENYSGRKRFYYFTVLFHSMNDRDYSKKFSKEIYLAPKAGFTDLALKKLLRKSNSEAKISHLAIISQDVTNNESKSYTTLIYKWPLHITL